MMGMNFGARDVTLVKVYLRRRSLQTADLNKFNLDLG